MKGLWNNISRKIYKTMHAGRSEAGDIYNDDGFFPVIDVYIPSYNRPDKLNTLVSQLDREADGFYVNVNIFDDGSDEKVSVEWQMYPKLLGLSISRCNNHGKQRYWHLVNHIFGRARASSADFFFYLADDVELVNGFFGRAIEAWEAIPDQSKVALNLILDHREGKTCWTDYQPHLVETAAMPVYKCQWVDMVMMFNRQFLTALDYCVEPVSEERWARRPLLSSGVGQQLSHRLHRKNMSMFQVTDSLVIHLDAPSMMNPEERKLNPIVSKVRTEQEPSS